MINTYSYIETSQSKLHEYVMAFFSRIEFETGDFSSDFFEKEFYDNLVSRHKTILKKAFKDLYNIIKEWEQIPRTELCEAIKRSNEIKEICAGNIIPWKTEDIPEEIKDLTNTLFVKLYKDVLMGDFYKPIYGTRKEHFRIFKQHLNNDYEYCPACAIAPLQTYLDDVTDQYDHYLPKDTYPFSSINFKNLVPICRICNSIEVKGTDDILNHNGVVFYPFDEEHKEIQIDVKITNNADEVVNIAWDISYSCPDGKQNELSAWKQIYKIETRHKTHIAGSAETWYRHFWNDFTDKDSISEIPDETARTNSYLRKIKKRRLLEHNSLAVLIASFDARARNASKANSRYAD